MEELIKKLAGLSRDEAWELVGPFCVAVEHWRDGYIARIRWPNGVGKTLDIKWVQNNSGCASLCDTSTGMVYACYP